MPALPWSKRFKWNDPRLRWNGQAPDESNTMADNSFCYITRPTAAGTSMTTMPKYRGTKTQDQVYAEVTTRLGATPLTVANITATLHQVIIDWSIACWKIEPLGDGLIGFLVGCGGSSPIGSEPPSGFVDMGIDLRGYYGPAGRARAESAFTAQKVGEQNRVTPVFVEIHESITKIINHYVSPGTLTIILGNRQPKFDPSKTGQFVRYRKADGTFVSAGSYPYINGKTIVANVPAGLTGSIELHLALELNGSVREGVYPFPLT